MKDHKSLKRVAQSLAACLLTCFSVVACSEEADCSMTARPMLNANVYTIDTESGLSTRDTIDVLTITALGTDSIILNNEEDVLALSLPLRYAADSTVLVFHYSLLRYDTVVIRHTNTPYFISMDCGYQMQQALTGTSYTRHVLDSISINNSEVGIYGTENIRLFY